MADQKKLSVAEILAAARKSDGKGETSIGEGETAASPAKAAKSVSPPLETEASATEASRETQAAEEVPAAEQPMPAAKPKPAGAGGRMSVAEMMAAARAEKGGGAAKPAAPKPVAAKPAASKPAAAKPATAAAAKKESPKPAAKAPAAAGPKDTASILGEARKSAKPGPMSKAEAALKSPAKPAVAKEDKSPAKRPVPPMPVKPQYAKPKPPAPKPAAEEQRRGFLLGMVVGTLFSSSLALGFTSLATTFGLWTLSTARFMFPNILTEPPSKFKVGFPSNFSPGQVETKFIPLYGVWVVNWEYNGQPQIYALRSVCTHLGCTPNWLEGEQKFKCPCHGSGFYKDGINFEGPAPRPLERYAIHLADDGQLEIDKSKIFQEEMGQWNDPSCYVPV